MISVTHEIYARLAARLFEELEKSGHFFNGRIDHDTPEFYSTLTCSAILYRSPHDGGRAAGGSIEKVVPVWWDFTVCVDGIPRGHDFSWCELTQYFPYA